MCNYQELTEFRWPENIRRFNHRRIFKDYGQVSSQQREQLNRVGNAIGFMRPLDIANAEQRRKLINEFA